MTLSELIIELQNHQTLGTDPEVYFFDPVYDCYLAQTITSVENDTDGVTIYGGNYKDPS